MALGLSCLRCSLLCAQPVADPARKVRLVRLSLDGDDKKEWSSLRALQNQQCHPTPFLLPVNSHTCPVRADLTRNALFLEAQTQTIPFAEKEANTAPDQNLALCLARLGQLQLAQKTLKANDIFSKRERDGWEQNIVGAVARRRAVLNDCAGAVALLPQISHPLVRTDVLLALARSNLHAKQLQATRRWVLEAAQTLNTAQRSELQRNKGRLDNADSYVNGFRQCNELLKALSLPAPTFPNDLAVLTSWETTSNLFW